METRLRRSRLPKVMARRGRQATVWNFCNRGALTGLRSFCGRKMICDRRLGKRLQSDGLAKGSKDEWHLNFHKSWRGRLIWMERAILAKREL